MHCQRAASQAEAGSLDRNLFFFNRANSSFSLMTETMAKDNKPSGSQADQKRGGL